MLAERYMIAGKGSTGKPKLHLYTSVYHLSLRLYLVQNIFSLICMFFPSIHVYACRFSIISK